MGLAALNYDEIILLDAENLAEAVIKKGFQLTKSNYGFYAINSGNDLCGMFLTKEQYKQAISSIKNKTDWPYVPTQNKPWYGQPH